MLYYECSFASLIFFFSFASIKVYFSRKFSWYISLIFNLEFRLTCCKMYNFSTIKKLLFFLSLSNMHLHRNIKSTVFVVLAVHEQVALMSFSWSKIRLLLYVHEQLPCHCTYCVPLFYICGYYDVQTTTLLKHQDI